MRYGRNTDTTPQNPLLADPIAVTLYQDIDQPLQYVSQIHTGLVIAAARGLVRFSIVYPLPGDWCKLLTRESAILLSIARDGYPPTTVCIDIHDMADRTFERLLAVSDVYIKRSYYTPALESLPPAQRNKVIPFGLNYKCVVPRSFLTVAFAAALALGSRSATERRGPRVLRIARDLVDYFRLLPPAAFEALPTQPKKQQVIFRPRLWADHEVVGDDVEAINEERIALVREFRKHFGKRFVGGVTANAVARERCPELIASDRGDQATYIRVVRESAIAVYSRGLHHSIAWKLAEYFAASTCVVMKPLRNELPVPLRPGIDVAQYTTYDECMTRVEELLLRPELQESMRHEAFNYYRNYCEPGALIVDCCTRALERGRALIGKQEAGTRQYSGISNDDVRPPESQSGWRRTRTAGNG